MVAMMSDDPFLSLLHTAWEKLQPTLARDPDELARRLARRHQGMMQRPRRAWCLAIRAADTRISPGTAACWPEVAAYPGNCYAPGLLPQYGRHDVTVTAGLVRKLCAPFVIPKPGITVQQLAGKLG